MKRNKWIKMPDGMLVKRRPDKIEFFLAEHGPYIPTTTGWDYVLDDTAKRQSKQQQYNTETFDIRKLTGNEVTVFGAGTVGSHFLYTIGPANLLINIIDCKKVQFKHTCNGRTIFDPTLVGLKKVYAIKQKIEHDFPGTKVNPYPYNTAEIPDIELKSMVARSLLGVVVIDDPEQMFRISDLVYPITDLIQVAMHTGAKSGHIALSAPFVTPCLRCTLNIEDSRDIHRLDSEPANSWDIMIVAQQAARIAIDIIYSKVTGQTVSRWDTSKNLIYISNTRQELSPDGPGMHFEGSQKRPGCPVCNRY
jgi:hypothetical protein